MSAARPVAVKLDPDVHARVRRLADVQNRPAHFLMREVIAQYVEREERREAFRQAGLTAWEAYRTTGLRIAREAADEWLAGLEAGRDAEPPECKG